MSSQKNIAGFIIALVCAGAAILAFFAMPFLTYFGIASITGQQLASLAAQYSQSSIGSNNGQVSAISQGVTTVFNLSGSTGSNNGQVLVILWAAPVVGGIIALIAALQFKSTIRPATRRVVAGCLIALGIVGIALYVGILIYLYSQSTSGSPSIFSYLGGGFWVYIIAMVIVVVGGSIALGANRAASVIAALPPPISSPSYPLYQQPQTRNPPYQQPGASSPQYPQYPPTERAPQSPQWPPSQPNQ